MCDLIGANNEGIGAVPTTETSLFQGLSLPNEACPACGHTFAEGDSILLYVYRTAGSSHYHLGTAVCGDDNHTRRTEFTLGVRETLLHARVGVCSDAATQSTWLVLLAPEVKGVSNPATKALNKPTEEKTHTPQHAGLPRFETTEGRR